MSSKDIGRRAAIAAQPKVPTAPQNIAATAGDGQAQLVWEVPLSSGTSPIIDYIVTVDPATGVTGATSRAIGTPTTGYTFTGLTNGTAYAFAVRAVNAVGNSVASGLSNSVMPGVVGAPDTPGNLAVSVSDGTAVHTFDEVAGAITYRVETELVG